MTRADDVPSGVPDSRAPLGVPDSRAPLADVNSRAPLADVNSRAPLADVNSRAPLAVLLAPQDALLLRLLSQFDGVSVEQAAGRAIRDAAARRCGWPVSDDSSSDAEERRGFHFRLSP